MTTTMDRPSVADFYERDVLPALSARLDDAFPEFGWRRDPQGWHATNQGFTHAVLGVRADRVVYHGDSPRGFLIHGEGPVLWTTYVNHGQLARGRDFVDAVRRLAARAGVDSSVLDRPPTAAERRSRLLEDAFAITRRELVHEPGEAAREYLVTRGIPADRLSDSTVGVMPPAEQLRLALESKGYTPTEIHASHLLADTRWPGRIVGAWRDDQHRIVTLWARAVDSAETARYLYLRGASRGAGIPYGLAELHDKGNAEEVTLVEGVIDVHALRAHGIAYVAALGGTSTTPRLFEQLAAFGVDRVVLALDNDAAGRVATARAIDNAVRASRSPDVWVIDPDLLAPAKDPGELIRTEGIDGWRAASAAPVCAITWRALDLSGPIDQATSEPRRRAALARPSAWLGNLPPRLAIEQSAAIDHVADSLGYDRDATQRTFRARYWRPHATPETRRRTTIER